LNVALPAAASASAAPLKLARAAEASEIVNKPLIFIYFLLGDRAGRDAFAGNRCKFACHDT
jgi:hypothetical protein